MNEHKSERLAKEAVHLTIEISKMKIELEELIKKRDSIITCYSVLMDREKS